MCVSNYTVTENIFFPLISDKKIQHLANTVFIAFPAFI